MVNGALSKIKRYVAAKLRIASIATGPQSRIGWSFESDLFASENASTDGISIHAKERCQPNSVLDDIYVHGSSV